MSTGGNGDTAQIGEIKWQIRFMEGLASGEIQVMAQRMADDFGLLIDLFQHEMAVVALVHHQSA